MFKYPLFKVSMVNSNILMFNLKEVLYSKYIADGEWTKKFEKLFIEKFKTDNLFATNSCTSSLTIALKCSNVGPGTSVVVSLQTCVATACPVTTLGADIIWADVNKETGMLDLLLLLKILLDFVNQEEL